MDKNEKIALIVFVSIFLLISIIAIYNRKSSTIETNNVIENNINKTDIQNTQNTDSTDNSNKQQLETNVTINNVIVKKLSVSSRCIGCGKCARIDAEHFKIIGERSNVISQNNLSSSNLQMAISMCPENAISLSNS